MKTAFSTLLTLSIFAAPAWVSAITVTTPASGAQVTSPFKLVASTATCNSKPVVSMGYSIDSSSNTTIVKAQSVQAAVVAPTGAHILHVKAWGSGTSCVTNVAINVVSATVAATVATPAFSLAAGTYASAQSVKLSDATTGATIYFTTNGAAPSTSSTKYTGAITVGGSQMIKAVAVASGCKNSGVATASYIIAPPPLTEPFIPPNAIASSDVQVLDTWQFVHDTGTPGAAVGTTTMVTTPSISGNARQFSTTYSGTGGERYSVAYASDTTSKNFLYDAWVWIAAGSSISNLEMDSNQVTANGQTIIYAFQCSGNTQTWEYSGAGAKWVSSSQPCETSKWQTNFWHHIQISYSRDDSGYVTYHSVWLDGAEQVIEETAPSSFALGWKVGVVQTQFQVDGVGASGSSVLYVDHLNVYRW